MKINPKSWHYWLNNKLSMSVVEDLRYGNTVSWCTYFWSTVGAFLKASWFSLLTVVGVAIVLFLTWLVFNAVAFLITGALGVPVSWVHYPAGMSFTLISSAISLFVSLGVVSEGNMKVVPSYLKFEVGIEPKNGKQPSFFYTAYKSWKDKFCPLVELEE